MTMIEVLVVLGLFTMTAAIGMAFSFDSYRAYLFRSEYGNISQLLAKARNYAANNFDESAHGVHIGSNSYTLFVGDTYSASDPNNITFEKSDVVAISGATKIVFEQLSGNLKTCDSSPSCEITFSYGAKTATVSVNDVGAITW